MASTVVGKLVVNLVANTKQFSTNLKKSTQHVSTFARVAAGAGKAMGVFAVAAATAAQVALAVNVKKQFEVIDALGKMSDRLGVATEDLQKMQHALDLTGAGGDRLNDILSSMSTKLGEAARGAGEAIPVLKSLGLDPKQLAGMAPDQAFLRIADAIKGVNSEMMQASVAAKIFGEGNREVINALMLGSEGLRALYSEREGMGLISREQAAQIEAANDAVTRMKTALVSMAQVLAVQVAPAVESMANAFSAAAKDAAVLFQIIKDPFGMNIPGRGPGQRGMLAGAMMGGVGGGVGAPALNAVEVPAAQRSIADVLAGGVRRAGYMLNTNLRQLGEAFWIGKNKLGSMALPWQGAQQQQGGQVQLSGAHQMGSAAAYSIIANAQNRGLSEEQKQTRRLDDAVITLRDILAAMKNQVVFALNGAEVQ